MRICDILKLCVPPIVSIMKNKLRNEKRSLVRNLLPQIEHQSSRVVVIGNGPSLNSSIEKYKEEIAQSDIIVVNEFGATDLFEVFKPKLYVFADPAYFTLPENMKDSVMNLFQTIVARTNWPMHIIIPYSYKEAHSLEIFRRNKYITIDCYYDGSQDVGKKSKFEAWDENLIAPPAQTVLNTCVYMAIYWNYKEIYLIGADTSFLESLRIDQESNDIFIKNAHFYKEEDVYSNDYCDSSKGTKMEGWTLHDLIYAYGKMFELYAELNKYAAYKGVKVYNASEYSWINVFERKKLA
jgi:hypothetical protein